MQKNQTTRIIIVVIVIILIGLVGYLIFSSSNTSKNTQDAAQAPAVIDNNSAASSTATEQGTTADLTGVGIMVSDQNPGRIVVVSQVYLNAPAWVVIHENVNGQPGNILGAREFEKGNNSGIIQLLNSMKVGKSYIAEVHSDDGDGLFETAKDLPLKDQNGKVVMTTFNVTQGSDAPTK